MGARLARRRLAALYLGHTEDDQAEPLRPARGSGFDGLTAMACWRLFRCRLSPADAGAAASGSAAPGLRDYLKARRQDWLEDPMNTQARFARSRIRALLPALAQAGLSARRIGSDAAGHLARACQALDVATAAVLARACCKQGPCCSTLRPGRCPARNRSSPWRHCCKACRDRLTGPDLDALERLFDRIAVALPAQVVALPRMMLPPGPAPARHRAFGPETLVIAKESSRAHPGKVGRKA